MQVFISLQIRQDRPNYDYVLRFLSEVAFHQVKVIMIGMDPSKQIESKGHAFHKVPCASTHMLLEHVIYEIEAVNCLVPQQNQIPTPIDHTRPQGPNDLTEELSSLREWIEQGNNILVLVNFMFRNITINYFLK